MNKLAIKNLSLIIIIMVLVLYRLLPHPFNVTPVMAMALFSGVYFTNRYAALIIPLVAMFLSDWVLGFHNTMLFVYGAMLAAGFIGFVIRDKVTPIKVVLASVSGSLLFFIVTNFGVWWANDFYSKDLAGLSECYIMALPFFQRTLIGDLFFNGVLFISFWYYGKVFLSKYDMVANS